MRLSIPILLYHAVGSPPPGAHASLYVEAVRFTAQLSWLARKGFTCLDSAQLEAALHGGPLPRRPIVLTFDDGYACLAEHAFPELERREMKAIVFVVTGQIGGSNAWDAAPGHPAQPLLDAAQLRHWSARGIDFQSHSRTHASLPDLPAERWGPELERSRSDLEALLGRPAPAFAYPYGHLTPALREATRAHYRLAFGTAEGTATGASDPFALPRRMVMPHDGLWSFGRLARGKAVPRLARSLSWRIARFSSYDSAGRFRRD